jgi:tetratricopeptide (TPR) repeat protein
VSTNTSEYDQAERWTSTARAIAAHLPANPSLDMELRYQAVRLAQLKNEFKECVRLGEETLRVAEAAKIESTTVNATMVAMARCYAWLEQRDKAVAYLERVLPRAKRLEGYYSVQTASTLTELGREARAAGNYDQALSYYREALSVREYLGGPEDPDCGVVHNNVANVLRDLKRYDEARASLQRALDIFRKAYDPDHFQIGGALNGMGRIAMAEGNAAAAEPFFRQGVAIMRKKRKAGVQLRADVALLAECLLAQRKPEALELFDEVLAGNEKDDNATDGDKADARYWAARARVELGIRREGAMQIAETSCKALDQSTDWKKARADCIAWLATHGVK